MPLERDAKGPDHVGRTMTVTRRGEGLPPTIRPDLDDLPHLRVALRDVGSGEALVSKQVFPVRVQRRGEGVALLRSLPIQGELRELRCHGGGGHRLGQVGPPRGFPKAQHGLALVRRELLPNGLLRLTVRLGPLSVAHPLHGVTKVDTVAVRGSLNRGICLCVGIVDVLRSLDQL
jgi:hypothetical protein